MGKEILVTYVSDGRTRSDASKRYGSGGLMQGKQYMLSITYNCPISEFNNKEGFFEGLSLDVKPMSQRIKPSNFVAQNL